MFAAPSSVLAVALLALLAATGPASAYQLKENGEGAVVRWPAGDVTFHVSEAGSKDLAMNDVKRIVRAAFSEWSKVEGTSLDLKMGEPTAEAPGFYPGQANTNVVAFARDAWPFETDAMAMTITAFRQSTGELVDADIIVNELHHTWGEGEAAANDLQNALTHEVGHFIGVAHSDKSEATMFSSASTFETKKRSLDVDDLAALRASYPGTNATVRTVQATVAPPTPGTHAAAAPSVDAPPGPVDDDYAQTKMQGCASSTGLGGSPLWLVLILAARAFTRSVSSREAGVRSTLAAALMLGVLSSPITLLSSANATVSRAETLSTLSARASEVAVGRVVDLKMRWQRGLIVTDVTLEVHECVKGVCGAGEARLVIQVLGGALDGYVMEVEGLARFGLGREVLVFLTKKAGFAPDGRVRFEVVGLAQGQFEVVGTPDGSPNDALLVRDLDGLELIGPNRARTEAESVLSLEDVRDAISRSNLP